MRLGPLSLFHPSVKRSKSVLADEDDLAEGTICVPLHMTVIVGWRNRALCWIHNERPRHAKPDTRLSTKEFLS